MTSNIKIIVDADACPVKSEIIEVALKYQLKMLFVTNISSNLKNSPPFIYLDDEVLKLIDFIVVDNIKDAADFAIVNKISKGDIVVTQDYGLASMAMAKGGDPISPHGKIFNEKNIDSYLEKRHLARKERQSGVRTKGPKQFTNPDRSRFMHSLEKLIKQLMDLCY